MRICAYVYMRTCVYARMHIYVHMYTYTYVYAYIWDPRDRSSCTEVAYIRTYVYVYMCIYVHTCTCICVYTYIRVRVYAYTCICVYVYIRIRVYLGPKRQIEVYRRCVKVCVYTYIRIRVYAYTCICVYVYTWAPRDRSRSTDVASKYARCVSCLKCSSMPACMKKKLIFYMKLSGKTSFKKVRVVPEVFFHACVHEKKKLSEIVWECL